MPVSALTTAKLREAMARLLAGKPLHTDGALTKENLAREAQVSHATVHRALDVLAEWDANRPVGGRLPVRLLAGVRRAPHTRPPTPRPYPRAKW